MFGCCGPSSNNAKDLDQKPALSVRASDYLVEDVKEKDKARLLIIGAAEAGKTTVLKQIKLKYGQGFSSTEVAFYTAAIRQNILSALRQVVKAMRSFELEPEPENAELVKRYESIVHEENIIQIHHNFLLEFISKMSKDKSFQEAIGRGNEYNILDSASYKAKICNFVLTVLSFFENHVRILDDEFKPSNQDILQGRLASLRAQQYEFRITKSHVLVVSDLGGAKGQRTKWAGFFDNSHVILFVVSLSCYDQALDRDPDENQMDDTFNAFSLVAKNDTLKDIPIILFLNKIDLFKKKIETSPISKYFPDYKDEERNFKKGCEFFEKKFRAVIPNKKRELYVYKTHATDTNQISAILQAVTDIMLRRVVMNL